MNKILVLVTIALLAAIAFSANQISSVEPQSTLDSNPEINYVGCLNESCSDVYFCWHAKIGKRELNLCQSVADVSSPEDAKEKINALLKETLERFYERQQRAQAFGLWDLVGQKFELAMNALTTQAETQDQNFEEPDQNTIPAID
ncbi:MAG: hypothetical protein V1847_05310, partial [Candidatus Diapherotrites archaeon]